MPSDEYLRNFGHAFSSRWKSDLSSAWSCQRLKSRRTLNCGSEPEAGGAGGGLPPAAAPAMRERRQRERERDGKPDSAIAELMNLR